MTATGMSANGLRLAYDGVVVVHEVDLAIQTGVLTAVVGPNGCGKSTLLKALARTLRPAAGRIELDGRPLDRFGARELARQVALLPQHPLAPEGIRVRDLVARGRHPHHGLLRQWSPDDAAVISGAMARTGVAEIADRAVSELSGGQRQRVWLAMALAQDTPHVLLDEPTSFLDIAHQIDLLHLCQDIRDEGRTVVVVLHDLNQAARYADHLVVMDAGRIVAEGRPERVLTVELVREVFGLAAEVVPDPQSGTPMIVPLAR